LKTGSNLLILIDDSEQIRFALTELLESEGYLIQALSGGQEGVSVLAQLAKTNNPPAAIVVDLVMEDVPGYDVIAAAKRHFPTCPVIAISGGTPNVDPDLPLDLAKRSGANICLRKPFGNAELLSALRSATK
jgi:CheY-like chemotaxis protein